jgi:hypothetical protein
VVPGEGFDLTFQVPVSSLAIHPLLPSSVVWTATASIAFGAIADRWPLSSNLVWLGGRGGAEYLGKRLPYGLCTQFELGLLAAFSMWDESGNRSRHR